METTPLPPVEVLLARAEALRRLARHLVRDAALADDVVQETWLAVLRRPAAAPRDSGGWLAGIVRHLAQKAIRRERRMAARAQRAARPQGSPATDDVVGRLETQEALVRAVRALPDPYRTAITQRYLDGLPPRAIAAAQGIPVATVRSHLRRGLEQLRAALDVRPGGRRAWVAVLVPLATRTAADAPALLPVLVAPALGAVAIAAAVVAVVIGIRSGGAGPAYSPVAEIAASQPTGEASGAAGGRLAAAPPRRSTAGDPRATVPDVPDGRGWVGGTVVDSAGRGLAGAVVVAIRSEYEGDTGPYLGVLAPRSLVATEDVRARATTAADGSFRLQGLAPAAQYVIRAVPPAPGISGSRDTRVGEAGSTALVVPVVAGRTVVGRVVGPGGHGTAATITLSADPPSGIEGARYSTQTTSDAEGRFEASVPSGAVRVGVRTEDRTAWFAARPAWDGERVFEIDVGGGATAQGRVLGPGDAPIAAARAWLEIDATSGSTRGTWIVSAVSDAQGRWGVEGLPGGRILRATAATPRFAPATAAQLDVELEAGAKASLDLRVRPCRAVRGRVVDGAGSRVADAKVHLEGQVDNDMFRRTTTTDATGRFAFEGLPPGSMSLVAWSPQHAPRPRTPGATAVDADGAPLRDGCAPVYVSLRDADAEIEVPVVAARSIAGRAVDAEGRPVEGALLTATRIGADSLGYLPDLLPAVATTDVEGAFHLSPLPPTADWVVEATTGALRSEGLRGLDLRTADLAGVVVRLLPSAAVAGRVLEADGTPARAHVAVQDPTGRSTTEVTTDGDGRFSVDGLGAGAHLLRVRGRFVLPPSSWPRVVLALGARVEGVEIRLEPRLTISGVVLGEDGKPAAGARIEYRAKEASAGSQGGPFYTASAEDGTFEVVVRPGTYLFGVDGAPSSSPVEAGARGVELRRGGGAPSAFLEGTILAPDGAPVGGATLRLWTGGDGAWMGSDVVVDGARFRIVRPPGGRSVLTVSAARRADGGAIEIQPFFLDPIPPGPVACRLVAGLSVSGRIVDEMGSAVRASVSVTGSAGGHAGIVPWVNGGNTETDERGGFRIAGLPEGEVLLLVRPRAPWIPPASPTRATAGQGDVFVVVTRGGSIAGTVLGPDGETVAGWTVTAELPLGTRSATTGASGAFALDGLPTDADVRLRSYADWRSGVESPYLAPRASVVRVGTRDVAIRLLRGVFVDGHVLDPAGQPVVRGSIVAVRTWPGTDVRQGFADARLAEDGAFRVGPVLPGPCRIFFQAALEGGSWASAGAMEVVAPAAGVELRVAAATTLRGRATGARPGTVVRWNPREGNPPREALVAADGTFRLDGVAARAGLLYAVDDEGGLCALMDGIVPSAEPIAIVLEPGASIEGRVEGLPDGERAWVEAVRGALSAMTQVQRDGTFRLRALPAGMYAIRLGGDYGAHAEGVAAGTTGLVLHATPR